VPAGRFCYKCSAVLRTADIQVALAPRYAAVQDRLHQLAVSGKTAKTDKRHATFSSEFSKFMAETGGLQLIQATPSDVVAWLMSKDDRSRTTVHDIGCPKRGTTSESHKTRCPTGCPRRLKASTIDSDIGTLRACFNALGITTDYDPIRGSGNPCISYLVRDYLYKSTKEQLGAGVTTRQAAVFDKNVYDAIIAGLCAIPENRTAVTDFNGLRDALMFAVLFHCVDRTADVESLHWDQLKEARVDGRPTLQVFCGINKTAGKTKQRRTITVFDDGTRMAPVQLYRALLRLLDASPSIQKAYGPRTGPIFRILATDARPKSTQVHRRHTAQVLNHALQRLGLADQDITPHSFRASGAIAALNDGLAEDIVMNMANWSSHEMFVYYTMSRVIVHLKQA
jgi:integrase